MKKIIIFILMILIIFSGCSKNIYQEITKDNILITGSLTKNMLQGGLYRINLNMYTDIETINESSQVTCKISYLKGIVWNPPLYWYISYNTATIFISQKSLSGDMPHIFRITIQE